MKPETMTTRRGLNRPAKVFLGLLLGANLCAPAAAQTTSAESISNRVLHCSQTADSEQRLTCYDTLAATITTSKDDFGARVDLPDALHAPSIAPPVASTPRAQEKTAKKINVELVRTEQFGSGRTRFFLANDQVWEQSEGGSVHIPNERDGRRNSVAIRRGLMGTYLLRVNGKGRSVRVKRIQ
ncbi:hypothetical protein GCM10009069_15510 [Algimonas arctica]|uniref:Secreted protein n=1 Tax=Algimonas arctica TaxID=1479486 RepID=A0A8J3CS69_9PROT|nr:hypothetical protein [Algimonas arctica]GHA93352.1 hypothetical protein GCM10009069_15510 [Algimonas arctica]